MVTATAVTATGVTAGGFGLPAISTAGTANVELAALANPLLAIYDTVQNANTWLFSIAQVQQPQPPLPQIPFTYYGMIPDWLGAGLPILTQYSLNASDYINQSINYMFLDYPPPVPVPSVSSYPGGLRLLTWAVDALPANIGYAASQLFAGNLVGVLDTVKFAVVNPLQAALYQALNSAMYVVGGVAVRAAAVITAVAEWIPDAVRHLADDVTVVGNAAFNVVRNVAYGIQTGSPEAVWNSLVVGLLGSTPYNVVAPTIPDALINQTIGVGGRLYSTPTTYELAPSIREDLTTLRDNLKDALATDVPGPADPPFPVDRVGPSYIPTPWQQTPNYVPPFAAARTTVTKPAASKAKSRSVAARAASR